MLAATQPGHQYPGMGPQTSNRKPNSARPHCDSNDHCRHLPASAPIASSSSLQLDRQHVMNLYYKGLENASQFQKKSFKPDTVNARQLPFNQLADWMQNNHAACNRSAQEAIPEDVILYFTQHCLPTHAGTTTSKGDSSTRQLVQHKISPVQQA